MSRKNNGAVAINAGGFADDNGEGTGGTPLGTTIVNKQLITNNDFNKDGGGLVGFNEQNVLVLDSTRSTEGIRDGVTFAPFLILNGESSKIAGNGGGGRAPRTAIGQRKDGIVLFLVLDGDRTLGRGATYAEELEIMQRYGAVNAANLDGGTSTCMTVKNILINDATALNGDHRSRPVATAFVLEDDGSDNGDSSIVANKLK